MRKEVKIIISLFLSVTLLGSSAKAESAATTTTDKKDNITISRPDPYGTIRLRSEWSTASGKVRSMVRTARLGVLGQVGNWVEYKAELDLCDRGEVKVTDVWGRFSLPAGFKIQAGQMRMPFTFGSTRAPHVYLFSDRPFVDKQFIGPRNVGIKGIWSSNNSRFLIEGGVFNSTSNIKHTVWQSSLSGAIKAQAKFGEFTSLVGYETLAPTYARTSNYDVGLTWRHNAVMIEGEYVHKHYNSSVFRNAYAYNLMANYDVNISKRGKFNTLSFQCRYDGMSSYSAATSLSENSTRVAVTEPRHERLTLGSTLSYIRSGFFVLFRLNYENYFCHNNYQATADENNKLSAEVVIHF